MILKLFNRLNKISEKNIFIFLLILNSILAILDIFIVKEWFFLVLQVVAVCCCTDTLIRIKKRGE